MHLIKHSILPSLLLSLPLLTHSLKLTLSVPPNLPALPPTTSAFLTAKGTSLKAPVTRANTFIFTDVPSPSSGSASYLLDIVSRDYEFAAYGVDIRKDRGVEVYRVGKGGMEIGNERVRVGDGPVEVRMLGGREVYEARPGFSPLTLLKNPMVLIGIVSLGFFMGMPYLMDSMDPEMKKEFEEQQKKSVLSGGTNANPLQNFDMAAWMAGATSGSSSGGGSAGREEGEGGGGGSGRRRRG